MSAEANRQLAQHGYAMFKKREIQGILDICADDVEWTSIDSDEIPFGGTFHGKDGLADYFMKLTEAVEFLEFEPRTFIAEGDEVVVFGSLKGKVRASGATYDDDWVHRFTIKNGKVVSMRQFHDTAAVLAAFSPMLAGTTQTETRLHH